MYGQTTFADPNNPSSEMQKIYITLPDAFSVSAWLLRCTLMRGLPGFLAPYESLSIKQMPSLIFYRAYFETHMGGTMGVLYRRSHYLSLSPSSSNDILRSGIKETAESGKFSL